MLIERKKVILLKELIEKKLYDVFDIKTQYKFLQLSEYVDKEVSILQTQISYLLERYAEKDEEDKIIKTEDGGIKIEQDKINKCQEEINEMHNFTVTLPDIYFTLDELKDLGLSLKELKILQPFIKE